MFKKARKRRLDWSQAIADIFYGLLSDTKTRVALGREKEVFVLLIKDSQEYK